MDRIWVNLKNVGPPFFQIFISLYQNVNYTAGKLCCCVAVILQMKDFLCQFHVYSSYLIA